MKENTSIEFWGNLDAAVRSLTQVSTSYRELWNGGACRVTQAELERIDKECKQIVKHIVMIALVSSKFEQISHKADDILVDPDSGTINSK